MAVTYEDAAGASLLILILLAVGGAIGGIATCGMQSRCDTTCHPQAAERIRNECFCADEDRWVPSEKESDQ